MEILRRAGQGDWTKWAREYDWNITGTLNFIQNRKPHIEEAKRQWRSYFNIVDRLLYGKTYKQLNRLPRFACVHLGGNGDNPHLQFVALSADDPAPLCMALNAIWAGFPLAAPPSENAITPTISEDRSINYGGHEHWFQGADTYFPEITHLPIEAAQPRVDAIERMAAYAQPIWRMRAVLAYPAHVQKACDDYNKRITKV